MSAFERAAQAYATNGFRVFPVHPAGKKPLHTGWQSQATADPAAVHELWTRDPDANVGVACGDGLIVLDADSPAAVTSLGELEVPATTTVRTHRGLHLYLEGNAKSRRALLPGVDLRGRGGYVVGAGSAHPRGGAYEWATPPWQSPPARAPEAVLRLLRSKPVRAADIEGPIPEGTRNNALTQIGGRLRRAQLGADAVLAALLAENSSRCRPPLQHEEVARIARSVSGMSGPPPWVANPLRFSEDPRLDAKARQVLHVLASRAHDDGTVRGGEWLMEATALSRNSVSRAVASIKSVGLVTVSGGGARRANLYRLQSRANTHLRALPPPKEVVLPAPHRCSMGALAPDARRAG